MSYIEKYLMNNEKIMYRAKLHGFIFFIPCLLAVVFFFIGISTPIISLGWIMFIFGLLFVIVPFLIYKTSEFAVTNKRVIVKTGLFVRNSVEILLQKVEGVQIHQGILGRMLDFGIVKITGTGGTGEQFKNIAMPFKFRSCIQEQIDKYQNK